METQIQCARDLVCYGPDAIVGGVLEFQVARELLAGRVDLLSCKVLSQWGEVTLFDLCSTFGHYDTAWALAEGGVRGCRLEAYHLGPYRWWCTKDGCPCQGWHTCSRCCFGFHVEQGVWMQDGDAKLGSAIETAKHVVTRTVFISRVLNCLRSGSGLPFAVSEEAMARLLDLAILTGDADLAVQLSNLWQVRPLRRWIADDLFGVDGSMIFLKEPKVLLAALSAGIDFTKLWCKGRRGELPFREALALSGCWSDFAPFLPRPAMPWAPRAFNCLAVYLLRPAHRDPSKFELCPERLQEATAAGVALKDLEWSYLRLLDMAILCGQVDCARLCLAADVEICGVKVRDLEPDVHIEYKLNQIQLAIGSSSERQAAARAAAREALMMKWRLQCEKRLAILQVVKSCLGSKPFPRILVDEVLIYAMDLPKIVQKLDLWDEVQHWHASIKRVVITSHCSHPKAPPNP